MTSFVHIDSPVNHAGVARVEAAVQSARGLRGAFQGARVVAAVLLAGAVAAMIVLADRTVATWEADHLLAGWVVLWAIAFAILGVYAPTVRRVFTRLQGAFRDWSARAASARADECMWQAARNDPRVMSDLQAAITRHENLETGAADANRRADQALA